MAVPELSNPASVLDDAKCYDLIRQNRWPDGVYCPGGSARSVIRDGHDEKQRHRQRYRSKGSGNRFDDLTGTIQASHDQPLRVRVLCLYFMALNLANFQIARDLGLNEDDVHSMASWLREGLVAKAPEVKLEGVVEIDEVYVVAGHKGNPAATQKRPSRTMPAAQGSAGPRHFGKGKTAHPRIDPKGRTGRSSHAGQFPAEDDQADH